MSDIVIRPPDTAIVEAESAPVVARAQAMVVSDKESKAVAMKAIAYNNGRTKFIENDLLGDVIASAHNAWKGLTSLRARLTGPFIEATRILNQKTTAWEAADKAQKQAEAAALQAKIQADADARRVIEIDAALESGNVGLANELESEPAPVPVIQPEYTPSTVEGVQRRVSHRAKVTNKLLLDRYVADHPEWSGLTLSNMPMLNKLAVSQGAAFTLPGVEAEEVVTRSVRGASSTNEPDIPY